MANVIQPYRFLSGPAAGRILRVDLSAYRIDITDSRDLSRRFLGGRGAASKIYFDEVPPDIPFDHPDNRLILSLGPLCGMPGGLGASRWGMYGKSPFPMAYNGRRQHFCHGNLGGRFGAELRFAGFDGLVVHGKADHPVCLAIEDDRVSILPATDLWGLSTVDTMRAMKARTEPKSRMLAIGPAGEHGVPLASVFADGDASCSGGLGAVMGAKNLKAIAVRGTLRSVPVADREELKRIEQRIRAIQRGNVKVWGLDFMAHGPRTNKFPCHGCMAHCLRVRYTADDGTSGKFMCQSRFFYMHHAWGYYGQDNDVPFLANRVCDEYGIDTWQVQALIEWLLTCHARGLITEQETGLDLSKVGSLEFIRDLVHRTAHREGFGQLLALGARQAAKEYGNETVAAVTRTDPYDPRYCTTNSLLFPFEPREPIQQLHEAGLVLSQWSSWAKGVDDAHITSEVIRGIAERFWGDVRAADMTTLAGKAEAARRIQDRQLAKECSGFCDWMFPLIDIPAGEDHVGDPSIESRILSAATGAAISEAAWYRFGERAFNLQRAILLREGHRAREDDVLPDEWHEQPIQTHVADPELLAPGREGRVVSQVGRRLAMPGFLRVRDEYYARRGWDVPTGLPSRDSLVALGLDDVAEDLSQRGLLVDKARGLGLRERARHVPGLVGELLSGLPLPIRRTQTRQASVPHEELLEILLGEQAKFNHPDIRAPFAGWNKAMQYVFPDIDQIWLIRFEDGQAMPPERLDQPVKSPDIGYEMDSWVLKAMAEKEISGEQAYLRRLLRLKASFRDMLKLQSLNKR